MSQFHLSDTSLLRLRGVKPALQEVVKRAIQITPVDFGVIEGVRSTERQQELVNRGASKTMHSKHLTGDAVDLMAYIESRPCWEIAFYDEIAEAVRLAAIELDVAIRWGAAWHVPDICVYPDSMEQAMLDYVDLRRSMGRRPFIDGPHFELMS